MMRDKFTLLRMDYGRQVKFFFVILRRLAEGSLANARIYEPIFMGDSSQAQNDHTSVAGDSLFLTGFTLRTL